MELASGKYLGINRNSFDAGGLIISETEYKAKVFEGWHSHKNSHISFIVNGGNLEKRTHRDIDATPGKLLFYHQDELHRNTQTSHPSKNINLEITEGFLKTHQLDESLLNIAVAKNPDAQFLLLKMYREACNNDQLSASSIKMLFFELTAYTKKFPDKSAKPAWVKIIRELLEERWQDPVNLNELACAVNLHPVTLSKHFPRYLGCTIGEYTRKVKIKHALQLIKSGKSSLTETACQCGFFDQSHFIRTFKEMTHFLPKAYQKF